MSQLWTVRETETYSYHKTQRTRSNGLKTKGITREKSCHWSLKVPEPPHSTDQQMCGHRSLSDGGQEIELNNLFVEELSPTPRWAVSCSRVAMDTPPSCHGYSPPSYHGYSPVAVRDLPSLFQSVEVPCAVFRELILKELLRIHHNLQIQHTTITNKLTFGGVS